MVTVANKVIDFLIELHAMDRLQGPLGTPRHAAIDLESATIYEALEGHPEGELLSAELSSGHKTPVVTHKLVEHLLVRHANAMATMEPTGGNSQQHYEHIREHFSRKTGFAG